MTTCLALIALTVASAGAPTDAATREQQRVADTGPAIERLRKADAAVTVVRADGSPVSGATVTVRQVASDFLFGGNIYVFANCKTPELAAAYRDRFAHLFNFATTDFYWKYYEPEQGKPRYSHTEKVVAWCAEHNIRVKGHPLLWKHTAGTADWARGEDAAVFERARIDDLVTRYRGRVHSWDVVNEPAHAPREVEAPFRWARAADPDAELVINDYEVLANGFPKYFDLVRDLLARGVPIDAVGIQGHFPLHVRFPLEDVQKHLDTYARLGKPLHISELTPCSGGQEILGSHIKGVWDEAAQADYAEKLYRVLFAHPAVSAITWWDVSDFQAWQKGGGLLREDMTPKPAYHALERLILKEWRTDLTLTTGADGQARFRGFHGRYEVVSGASTGELKIRRDGLNAARLQLP